MVNYRIERIGAEDVGAIGRFMNHPDSPEFADEKGEIYAQIAKDAIASGRGIVLSALPIVGVGFFGCVVGSASQSGYNSLKFICIARDLRGCGIGRGLLERYIEASRQMNTALIETSPIRDGNTESVGLFRSSGFELFPCSKGYSARLVLKS